MFTVKKKPLTPNIIWDGSAGRPLCSFGHRGLLETNDPELAEKLAAMGHMVTGDADVPVQQPAPKTQPEDNGMPDVDVIASGLADRLQAAVDAISGAGTDRQPEETEDAPAQGEPLADAGLISPECADTDESAPQAEADTGRKPEQAEEVKTADAPEKQAVTSAAKKKQKQKAG